PLNSLPYIRPAAYPHVVAADPFAERGPLPAPRPLAEAMAQAVAHRGPAEPVAPSLVPDIAVAAAHGGAAMTDAGIAVRTALAVEPRNGRLCVFMPPTERLEDYLELLVAVEATACDMGLPIHIEGYEPPYDPRLNVIKVTPDPGVIEVNIHPSA